MRKPSSLSKNRAALADHLRKLESAPDPVSLARSYGLPVAEVERIIGSVNYAR